MLSSSNNREFSLFAEHSRPPSPPPSLLSAFLFLPLSLLLVHSSDPLPANYPVPPVFSRPYVTMIFRNGFFVAFNDHLYDKDISDHFYSTSNGQLISKDFGYFLFFPPFYFLPLFILPPVPFPRSPFHFFFFPARRFG